MRIDEELKELEPQIKIKTEEAIKAQEANDKKDKDLQVRQETISRERKKNNALNNKIQQEKRKAEMKSEKFDYQLKKIWKQVDENLTPNNLSLLKKLQITNMHKSLQKIAEALCTIYNKKDVKNLQKEFTQEVVSATKKIKQDIEEDRISDRVMNKFIKIVEIECSFNQFA